MDWKEIFKKQDMSTKGTKHTKGGQKSTFVAIVPIVDRGRKLKKDNQPTFVPCVPIVDKGIKLKKISQYTNPIRTLPNTAKNLKNKSSVQKIQNIQKAEPENKLTPPTAKRPFYSFCSTPGGHISEKGSPAARAKKRPPQKIRLVTRMMVETWRVGRAWILEHLGELEAAGWTRHKLLRAGRFSYPCGTWGPAFTGPWAREGVKIEVEASGDIVWAWEDATGRVVRQRAARISTTSKTN